MIIFHYKNNLRNCALALTIMLSGCGGSASQFSDENIDPVTIEPITGLETGGDDGGEGGSDGSGTPTIGGSLTPEEFALLPEVSTGQRQFADPNVSVTLFGNAQAKGDATITNTLWQQVGDTNAIIISPTRLNTQVLVPATDVEAVLSFQLVAQDSEGRVNASTTSIVVEPINTVGVVSGGIVAEDAVTATFTFKLSEPSDQATVINYATFDGTAKAGVDYEETIGTATLEPGVTDRTIEVTLLNPGVNSDSKSFYMRITVPTDEVVAVTTVGAVIIQSDEITELAAPDLTDILDRQLVINEAIQPITFENAGGNQILRCLAPAGLPTGLDIFISPDEQSCEISGTPIELNEEQSYMVVATNPSGISGATVNISVVPESDLEIPVLGSIAFQSFTVGTEISTLLFVNSGGPIDSCESIPPLPAGLILSTSLDGESNVDSCEMSGTPSAASENMQYSIRAINSAGVGAIGTSLEVTDLAPLPNLTDLPLQTLLVSDTAIRPIIFDNTGGGDISSCVANPTLPTGLNISPSDAQDTCVISGIASISLEQTTYEISVTNPSGTSLSQVSISIEAPIIVTEAPDLQRLDLWVISTGEDIQPIPFQNNGGSSITRCADITEGIATLESVGLQVVPTDDLSSCQLIGSYVSESVEGTFNLFAENAAGSNEFQVALDGRSFATSISLPTQNFQINDPVSERFTVGTQSYFSSCTVEPQLPAGLQVMVTEDVDVFNTCVITGTPTELSDPQTYIFSAENPNGTVTEDVTISVLSEEDFIPPSIGLIRPKLFTVGQDITFFDFQNTGGEITSCSSQPALPQGLAIELVSNEGGTDCRLSGTPQTISAQQDYVISASNAGGTSTSTITIEVTAELIDIPVFLEEPDLVFEVGAENVEFTFVNSGGAVDNCSSDRTLPMGLDVNAIGGTCVISGAPILRQTPVNYVITASNDSGDETADITIANYAIPTLINDLDARVFTVGETITGFGTIQDSGGDDLISCTTSPALPTGLLYELNADSDTCSLVGSPSTAAIQTEYTLFAENQVGTGDTTILITVDELVTPESFEIPFENASALEISITVSAGEARIDWDDGSAEEVISSGAVERTFTEPSTGIATITISNGFDAVTDFRVANNAGSGFTFDASTFENFVNLESFSINHGTLNGNLSSFSGLDKLTSFFAALFTNGTSAVFEGDISDIPASLTSFTVNVPNSTISGDIANFKSEQMTSFRVFSNTDITGQLNSLSSFDQLDRFEIMSGDNAITGLLSDLPNSLSVFEVNLGPDAFIEGNLSDLSGNIRELEIYGPNNITGNLSLLTETVTRLIITEGSNTIQGDIQNLSDNITTLTLGGFNTIEGDLSTLPTSLTALTIEGNNTLSGNIQDLPATISTATIYGQNIIAGDLGQLLDPSPFIRIGGLNTITFVDATATWQPADRVYIELTGDSTLGMTLNETDDFLQYIADTVTGTNTSSRLQLSRIGDSGRSFNSEIAADDLQDLGFVIAITLIFTEG